MEKRSIFLKILLRLIRLTYDGRVKPKLLLSFHRIFLKFVRNRSFAARNFV